MSVCFERRAVLMLVVVVGIVIWMRSGFANVNAILVSLPLISLRSKWSWTDDY